jgi:hypothetical protein
VLKGSGYDSCPSVNDVYIEIVDMLNSFSPSSFQNTENSTHTHTNNSTNNNKEQFESFSLKQFLNCGHAYTVSKL